MPGGFSIAELYVDVEERGAGKLTASFAKLEAMAGQTRSKLQGMTQAITRMGMAAGVAAAAFGVKAVVDFANFEEAIVTAGSVMNATEADFNKLSDAAKQLGATTAWSAAEAASTMTVLARAGMDVNQILESMPSVLDLATAGELDLASAGSIASGVMNGMQLEAKDLSGAIDMLAKASNMGDTDLRGIGEAFSYGAAAANQYGQSLEDTSAVLAIFANSQIKGSRAGTIFRSILDRIAASAGQNALEQLGVASQTAAGQMLPLPTIIDNIGRATQGMTAMERGAEMTRIFGRIAGPGLAALLNQGGEGIRKFSSEIKNSVGEAARLASDKLNTFWGSMKILQSAFSALSIEVGANLAPVIRGWAEDLTALIPAIQGEVVPAVKAFAEGAKEVVTDIVAWIAENGDLIISVGKLAGGIAAMVFLGDKILGLVGHFASLGKILSPLVVILGAKGLIVAGIVAIIALIADWGFSRQEKEAKALADEIKKIGEAKKAEAAAAKKLDTEKKASYKEQEKADEVHAKNVADLAARKAAAVTDKMNLATGGLGLLGHYAETERGYDPARDKINIPKATSPEMNIARAISFSSITDLNKNAQRKQGETGKAQVQLQTDILQQATLIAGFMENINTNSEETTGLGGIVN